MTETDHKDRQVIRIICKVMEITFHDCVLFLLFKGIQSQTMAFLVNYKDSTSKSLNCFILEIYIK